MISEKRSNSESSVKYVSNDNIVDKYHFFSEHMIKHIARFEQSDLLAIVIQKSSSHTRRARYAVLSITDRPKWSIYFKSIPATYEQSQKSTPLDDNIRAFIRVKSITFCLFYITAVRSIKFSLKKNNYQQISPLMNVPCLSHAPLLKSNVAEHGP